MNKVENKQIRDILSESISPIEDKRYMYYVSDLIENEVVLSMKNFIQHGSTTCCDHCLSVSYYSYKIAKKFNLDAKSAARAGLLHDLFLYDWHKVLEKKPLFQKHGFTHPRTALENACKYFNLNEIEKDIIEKHMWPLTLRKVPKYKESVVVTMVDKYCSTKETFSPLVEKIKKLNFITRKQYL